MMKKALLLKLFLITIIIGTVAFIFTRYLHVPTVLLMVIKDKIFLGRTIKYFWVEVIHNIAHFKLNGPIMMF
jgi:hypothetical protein